VACHNQVGIELPKRSQDVPDLETTAFRVEETDVVPGVEQRPTYD
jgi:hypothetical protein